MKQNIIETFINKVCLQIKVNFIGTKKKNEKFSVDLRFCNMAFSVYEIRGKRFQTKTSELNTSFFVFLWIHVPLRRFIIDRGKCTVVFNAFSLTVLK